VENLENICLEPFVWFFSGQPDGEGPVRRTSVTAFPFRVGRRADCDLTLPCDCVSGNHAEVFVQDNSLFVRDLGSTNGTYVNGQRITDFHELRDGDIVQFATVVMRVGQESDDITQQGTIEADAGGRALSMMQFERLINEAAVVPFFQPIVKIDDELRGFGFEVLGRSRLFGLSTPAEMFSTAAQFNSESELSRILRRSGLEAARALPVDSNIFVNTHPTELERADLIDSLKAVRRDVPDHRITLEIHEAAVTNPEMIRELRDQLMDLNMGVAFDDFGAGQARLVELSEVRPDFLKFDKQLIQGIDRASPSRQEVVATLVHMVEKLGISSLAECVETNEEHETLKQMGFCLGQGFLYGRPSALSAFVDRKRS
jgi:EAL domain-containing protein (putative c-di-GMP-specific phosphodiesterase class I)